MRWMALQFLETLYNQQDEIGGVAVDKTVSIRSEIIFSRRFASIAGVNLIGGKPLGTGNDHSTFSILIYRILRRHQVLL